MINYTAAVLYFMSVGPEISLFQEASPENIYFSCASLDMNGLKTNTLQK